MRICLISLLLLVSSVGRLGAQFPSDYSQIAKPTTLKILIVEGAQEAILEVKGRYDIFDPSTQLLITSGILSKRATLRLTSTGFKWGDLFHGVQQLRIVPASSQSSILVNGIEYRGCIEIYNFQDKLQIINEVDVESFLKSTLSVVPISVQDPKVLEAIAIVARTNAYYLANRNAHKQWHFNSEEYHYLGYGVTFQHLGMDKAIEATPQIILSYKGEPFATTWTENSAGRTAMFSKIFRKETPSPEGVAVPMAAEDREQHHWALSLTKQELALVLGIPKVLSIVPYLDQHSEKTYALRIHDGIQNLDIDFFTFQNKLGKERLLSNDFSINTKGEKIIFHGWGIGHGVGLCLYGATRMAQQGKSVAEILAQFFPDTDLSQKNH